ncbi:MAG: RnfABCDGE type electron transport complex subunit A [Thermodesulfobacteriota bacterium]|nr:RnfABCDGE type electron transport complex subunit A [Desulfovibrionales bacterium]MDD5450686.1 RnfABCDGE type electron transport complex subunit A [Desulfovibrionales bacterium]MDQ7837323.1 RnfABCDGE type electron transport complex subunit A [Thermodesulfobacteriota bacterium]
MEQSWFMFILSAIIINNILLIRFLGNCPFLGVTTAMDSAIGMSAACIFVNVLSGVLCWIFQKAVLDTLGLEYLQTLAFILIIAGLVQFVEMVLQKMSPGLYRALGIYLPLITTNCMIFGVAVLNIQEDYDFMHTVVYSIATAVGFSVAMVIMAGIRERMRIAHIPKLLDGVPLGLITAGMIGLSFFGLAGVG